MRQVCASQNIILVLNKPLHDQAAGIYILEDSAQGWKIVWKITVDQEAKLHLGQLWNFEDNLSAKCIILQ